MFVLTILKSCDGQIVGTETVTWSIIKRKYIVTSLNGYWTVRGGPVAAADTGGSNCIAYAAVADSLAAMPITEW